MSEQQKSGFVGVTKQGVRVIAGSAQPGQEQRMSTTFPIPTGGRNADDMGMPTNRPTADLGGEGELAVERVANFVEFARAKLPPHIVKDLDTVIALACDVLSRSA